jgi:hypothetical protein
MILNLRLAQTIIHDRLQSAEQHRVAYQYTVPSARHSTGRNHLRGATTGPATHELDHHRPRPDQATPGGDMEARAIALDASTAVIPEAPVAHKHMVSSLKRGSNEERRAAMRRLFIVITALALIGAIPVAASATTVFNETGRATVIESYWGTETPDGWTGGSASAATVDGDDTTLYFFEYTEAWVMCSGGDTPDDPDDDVWGFVSTFTSGDGLGELDLNGRFTVGDAAALMDLYSFYVNDCTGEVTETVEAAVPIIIHLESTSPVIKQSGSNVFHIPGADNDRFRFSSSYREGDGTVQVGESTVAVSGAMGKTSWRIHYNG